MPKRCQHGLRSKQHRNDLFAIFSPIHKELDNVKPVAGLFFDYSKAFDIVNIQFVMEKLNALGIRENIFNLIESYLLNRKIKVRMKRKTS